MSSTYLFGSNSIFAKIDTFTSFGLDLKLDKMLGFTRPETEGPRLGDLSVQTSTYGMDIPRIYGTIAGAGNLIQLENNKLKETVRKKKKGGKGGGGASEPTTTYSYSATFQLALCEGPIAGVRRIWCSDKLIYNAGSGDLETIIASNQAAKGWRLYLGTDSQLPDPRYEAEYGVGNVSAHRGLAYINFYDFQLADYSNTLQGAQFKVEVVSASNSSAIHQIGAHSAEPTAASFRPGHPGGTLKGPYFGTAGGAAGTAWKMSQSGRVSPVAFDLLSLSGYSAMDIEGIDTYSLLFADGATSTEDMIFCDFSGWSSVTSPYKLQAARIIERAGFIWIRWTNDFNNSDPAPGATYWVARFEKTNTTLGDRLVQGAKRALSNTLKYAGTPDGNLAAYGFGTVASSNSGTCSVAVYDANIDLVRSGGFAITTGPNGGVATSLSTGYVDSSGVLHIVAGIQGPPTSGRGRVLYMAYDTVGMQLIKIEEVRDPVNADTALGYLDPKICREEYGVVYCSGVQSAQLWLSAFSHGTLGVESVSVASIVTTELESVLIPSAEVSTALLAGSVRGYRVSGGGVRAAIEPLQAAYQFDVIQSGYKLKFVSRGQSNVATIPWEDLGATSGDKPEDIFSQSREMDTQLPARTTVKYIDAAREYAISEQYHERINTEAVNKVERELALVLNADEAAQAVEILQNLPWLERTAASFTLPPIYQGLESADVITVAAQQATYEVRLTEVNYTPDGRLECKAKPERAALYASTATGAEGVPPSGTVPLAGDSILLLLDIPVVDETLQDAPGFVGVMTGETASWPGGLAVRSADGGQTWADLQAFAGKASIGTARGTLPASSSTLIDQRSLTVDMISGELDSVTRDQMLSGINYAAYGVDGRWEIVRFQNAPLQVDESYIVNGFIRGEHGTEWATGLHVAGDYFVLLDDPDNAFISMAVGSIGVESDYRGITSGASLDDSTDVPFTYQGVNLECLSPVYAKGSRDGSSNFSGTFTRRARLSSSWWTTGVEAPLGETTQAYEIDVMSGSTVVRTITASTPAFSYSAADQTADFGSAQSSITFRIYQLSSTVGRGYPLEVTL